MSDVLYHARPTLSQQAAIAHQARFRANIAQRAVVVPIQCPKPEAVPVPVRVIPPDEIAFGPIVYHAPRDFFPNVKEVSQIVANYYGIGRSAMITARRDVKYCRPRQVAMYLCHILTPRSYPQIGRGLGNRDHTTIINGVRKIQADICSGDGKLMADMDTLMKRIIAKWPECALKSAEPA